MSYLERRAERQVTATLHLANQANASTNLAVAHDTKILAMASKRGSSSMKILAAVTTAFLPGAFVATLFSMNMFNWLAGDGTPVVSERFWIYWSVTIPLTLTTAGIWLGWEFWTTRKHRIQNQALDEKADQRPDRIY
jgi:Mg2+ and Co2+ transporter CorA